MKNSNLHSLKAIMLYKSGKRCNSMHLKDLNNFVVSYRSDDDNLVKKKARSFRKPDS